MYSLSVIGNIDVPKKVLRRLRHEWQTNTDFRNDLISRVIKPRVESLNENWWKSFDSQVWSYCEHNRVGLYRNDEDDSDPIYLLEEARCTDAPG